MIVPKSQGDKFTLSSYLHIVYCVIVYTHLVKWNQALRHRGHLEGSVQLDGKEWLLITMFSYRTLVVVELTSIQSSTTILVTS